MSVLGDAVIKPPSVATLCAVDQIKLEAEVTFFEGAPDPSEMVAPAVSILTVIGIIPFTAAVARQAWVKYTLTSRRIKASVLRAKEMRANSVGRYAES